MKALVLAGGAGSRMSRFPDPKPLIKINDEPMLRHRIRQLFASGVVDEIIFALGENAGEIASYLKSFPAHMRDRFHIVRERTARGTGGGLLYALQKAEHSDEPIVALNADVHTDIDIRDLAQSHRMWAHHSYDTTVVITPVRDISDFGYVEHNTATGRVTQFTEKTGKGQPGWANAGWYVLSREGIEDLLGHETQFSMEHHYLPVVVAAGHCKAYRHEGEWSDLGTPDRLWAMRKKLDI